jgi:rod shape determining protein RodA
MAKSKSYFKSLDPLTVALYAVCVMLGWINVYAAVYNPEVDTRFFDMSTNSGRQFIWIITSIIIIIFIMVIDYKFFDTFAFFIYGFIVFLCILVIFIGANIKGSHSWFRIGDFGLQPAEFAKMATSLVLAKYLSSPNVTLNKTRDRIISAAFIIIPMLIILLEREKGVAIVFVSFIIILYKEGLPGIYPLILILGGILGVLGILVSPTYVAIVLGIIALAVYFLFLPKYEQNRKNVMLIGIIFLVMSSLVFSVDIAINKLLEPHQRKRIEVLFNPDSDPRGDGYNVTQSKIAIGSGGFLGKGFLEGTQTKFDFVPEQSTDFIFCTIGEEYGFIGSMVLIALLVGMMLRIMYLADRQRSNFARIYGYCVVSIIFFHFMVNIGMTIGLMPVVGIPLPFFSYGGSGLWSFTTMLFIFLKLDSHRNQLLSRHS